MHIKQKKLLAEFHYNPDTVVISLLMYCHTYEPSFVQIVRYGNIWPSLPIGCLYVAGDN